MPLDEPTPTCYAAHACVPRYHGRVPIAAGPDVVPESVKPKRAAFRAHTRVLVGWRTLTPSRRWQVGLVAVGALLLLLLATQVVPRVSYPWDLYFWSESPFLTNMLKLRAGEPVYGDPSDANSFVYTPGLEYLTYAVLAPFGVELHIVACRFVSIVMAVVACLGGTAAGSRLLRDKRASLFERRAFLAFGTCTLLLVLFKNFTADICHPDNLSAAHACLTLLLCCLAAERATLRSAVGAVALGSLGVYTKQTSAAVGLVAFVGLLLVRPDLRSPKRAALLAAVALGVTASALAPLLLFPHARFWTFEVLAAHPLDLSKVQTLVRELIASFPYRAVLYALVPFAWSASMLSGHSLSRRCAMLWLAVGCGSALPALMGYFKVMGDVNNLGLLDLWAAVLVVPSVWHFGLVALERERNLELAAVPIGVLLLLLGLLFPTRVPPTPAQWEFGNDIEASLVAARASGDRVLVDHGTSALIRAGYLEVPLDRANSTVELVWGKKLSRAKTAGRIRRKLYDRIYFGPASVWYFSLRGVILANYKPVQQIAAPVTRNRGRRTEMLDPFFGYQALPHLMNAPVDVMVPIERREQ